MPDIMQTPVPGDVRPSALTAAEYRRRAREHFPDGRMPQLDAMLEPADQEDPEQEKPGLLRRFGRALKRADAALMRGVARGAEAGLDLAVGTAVEISQKTGLFRLGRDEKEEQEFMEYWDSDRPMSEKNPLRLRPEQFEARFGSRESGVYGVVETVGQVGVGLLATRGAGIFNTARAAGAPMLAAGALEGAAIDFTFFDPYEDRLSNLAQDLSSKHGMTGLAGMFGALAANPDDSEMEGRLKNLLEGGVIGSAVEVTFRALRGSALSRWLKSAEAEAATPAQRARAEQLIAEDAATVAKHAESATVPMVDDVTGMTRTVNPDGTATVRIADQADESELDEIAGLSEGPKPTDRERRLAREAYTSESTGLYNKRALEKAQKNLETTDAQRRALAGDEAAEVGSTTEHVVMDAGGLKAVNDQLGHEAGDAFLKSVAEAMRTVAKEMGLPNRNLFHQSGDEFTAMVPPGKGQEFLAKVQAIVGDEPIPGEAMKRKRLDGAVAPSMKEADLALAKFKRERGAGFQRSPDSPDVVPMDERELQAQFNSPEAADQFVAASRMAQVNAMKPRWSDETAALFASKAAEIQNVKSLDELEAFFNGWGSDFNFKYNLAPADILANIEALSRLVPDMGAIARGLGMQPRELTEHLARVIFRTQNTAEALAMGRRVFGQTETLPQQLLALRMQLTQSAANVQRLSKLLDQQPDNAVLAQELYTALDNLWEFHSTSSGTAANVARSLDQQKIDPAGSVLKESELRRAQSAQDLADAAGTKADGTAATPKAETQPKAEDAKPAKKEKAPKKEGKDRRLAPGQGRLTSQMNKRELLDLARNIDLAEGRWEEVLDAMTAANVKKAAAKSPPTLIQKAIQWRMFAMLSRPTTWAVNTLSNTFAAGSRPIEMMWAGVRTGNAELRQEGADQFVGLFSELADSWRMAGKAWRVGENLLDRAQSSGVFEGVDDIGLDRDFGAGTVWSRTLDIPRRVLMTTDEFFKQLNYRANVRMQALAQARKQGITDPRLIHERIESALRGAFENDAAINPAALDFSRMQTFTNTLEVGTLGRKVQDAANEHPFVRLVVPFVRTPINLFKYTWHRTPGLARLSSEFMREINAGGRRAAIAKGQVELGGAMYATAAMMAYSGMITGRGPSNPQLRKQWLDAGNEPYTIRIPGVEEPISYFRADPVFTPVGLAADAIGMAKDVSTKLRGETEIRAAERALAGAQEPQDPLSHFLANTADIVHASGELSEEDFANLGYAMVASVLANASSKTFMQGVTQFFDATTSGNKGAVEQFFTNTVGSFVPNALRSEKFDPTYREVSGLIGEVLSRTPWSSDLEPRRNILGEPVMKAPGTVGQEFNLFTPNVMTQARKPEADPLLSQLVELGRAIPAPARQVAGGRIDLTDGDRWNNGGQSPYDRMLELLANPKNGRPLREQLQRIVDLPAYQNASDGTVATPGGLRFKLVYEIIESNRQVAYQTMLNEFPELRRAILGAGLENKIGEVAGPEGVARTRKSFFR